MSPSLRSHSTKENDRENSTDESKLCGICKEGVPEDCAMLCDGMCEKWYHLNCVKLTNDDYVCINDMADKVKWFCPECDTKLESLLKGESSNFKTNYELGQLRHTVDVLLSAVKGIVDDNVKLNDKMDNIIESRLEATRDNSAQPIVAEDIMPTWSRVKNSIGRGRGRISRQSQIASSKAVVVDQSNISTKIVDIDLGKNDLNTHSNYCDSNNAVDVDSNELGWKTVNYRKSKPNRGFIRGTTNNLTENVNGKSFTDVVIGKRTDCVIKSVQLKPLIKKKAIFLSRLSPDCTTEDLGQFIKDELNLQSYKCNQIKTKYEGYSSFHIEVLESDFDKLLCADLWPKGCIFAPFKGILRRDLIIQSSNQDVFLQGNKP